MLRTLLRFGGRVLRSPILRVGSKVGPQNRKAAARALRRKSEVEAEKQFLKLISTARLRRQRQIADATKRALAAKSDEVAETKNNARYAHHRKIATAELAAVRREVAQRAAQTKKPQAASSSVKKAAKRVKVRHAPKPSRTLQKKQAESAKRFLATLQQRLERRKARVAALVEKKAKIEEAKEKAKAKAESKAEALAKAEAAALAEQRFEETIRQRQEKRAAQVKALVEKRKKAASEAACAMESEPTSASEESELTEEIRRLMEERDAHVQAIIAEHMGAEEATDSQEHAETATPAPTAEAATSHKRKCNVKESTAALLETSDDATVPPPAPPEVPLVESKMIDEPVKKPTTPRRRGRPPSAQRRATSKELSTAAVEVPDEVLATPSEVDEAQTAEELLPSRSQQREPAASDMEELASAHEDFVLNLEKAKQRTTAPPAALVSPVPSTPPVSASDARRAWIMAENPTGLFRL
ncbi:hypothetical protein, conserved [Leishmania tarentolae]|uniref:Uncharacterized protein n=1 Tax=Leishmania tarentolae TaxID=5689 RepID=A0A640KRC8_LEITA|nr:hypothetical protein, conserved [Leishmania tarentolae]